MSNLKQIRKAKEISRRELSDVTGISIENIKSYELGRRLLDNATPSIICRLAAGLDVSVSELISVDDFNIFSAKLKEEINQLNNELSIIKASYKKANEHNLLK